MTSSSSSTAGRPTIDVSGWTIQYASASGTTWQATALTGSIAPGRHYLVQLASAAAVGAPLPTPDATGTTNLAVSGGKVAVVRDATLLTCGASAGSCSAVTSVADLVGYGTAADYEGAGAAARPRQHDRRDAWRQRMRGHRRQRERFRGCDVPTPRNSSSASDDLQCRAAATHGRRLAERGGRHRHPTRPLDRARALRRQLRERDDGRHAAPVSERVTVVSNNSSGYAVTVRRTAFLPADLPLGIAGTAPSGGQIGGSLAGGAMAAIPIAPAPDLLVGTTAARSAATGDVWDTRLGFVSPLPVVPAGTVRGDGHVHGDRSMSPRGWASPWPPSCSCPLRRARARPGRRSPSPPLLRTSRSQAPAGRRSASRTPA